MAGCCWVGNTTSVVVGLWVLYVPTNRRCLQACEPGGLHIVSPLPPGLVTLLAILAQPDGAWANARIFNPLQFQDGGDTPGEVPAYGWYQFE
jgi:hypothetical protein